MKRDKIRYIFYFLIAVGLVWIVLNYSGSFWEKLTRKSPEKLILNIGVEEQVIEDIAPLLEEFAREKEIRTNVTLVQSQNREDFDILLSTQECANHCEKIAELPSEKIGFVNFEQTSMTGIYLHYQSRFGLVNELRDFLKNNLAGSETELLAVGDIMLSRHVSTKIFASGNLHLPFLKTRELTRNADIAFANLESPFNDSGPRVTKGMAFKAEPETIEGLKYAGFDILSLANNHFGNQGRKGMLFTFKHLEDNDTVFVGAGKDFKEAHQHKIIEKNKIKFCFLAYTGGPSPTGSKAGSQRAGYAWMDIESLKKDVGDAQKDCDSIIVSMHAGIEYTPDPNQEQIRFAHTAIDAGASLVIGHHPHVVQAFERYNDGLIFYSLGNFVFDQMWSEETREGVAARINFVGSKIKSFELIPIKIYDYNQPQVVRSETLKNTILNRIVNASQKLTKEQVI